MSTRLKRIEKFKPPADAAPKMVEGPVVVEYARDRIVPASTEPGSVDAQLGVTSEPSVVEDIVTFTLSDGITPMLLLEMAAVAGSGVDEGDTEAQTEYVKLIWDILNDALPPAELRKFKRWAKTAQPKVEIPELIHVIGQMVGALTARPTEELSSLPSGPLETPTGSTAPTESDPATGAASAL